MSKYIPKGRTNICFDCKKACGGCSWTEIDPQTDRVRFEPVPGWDATKSYLNSGCGGIDETYHIKACPLYEKDDERVPGNNVELSLSELQWLMARWRREDI